jgi:hypothetical protein
MRREAFSERAECALQAFFFSAGVSPTIKRMELMRFLTEAVIELVRDTVVNLSGRAVEEFLGKRVKRRRRGRGRRTKPKTSQ